MPPDAATSRSPAVTDFDGDTAIADDLLAACVHCGFCVPVCPTWDILREENDSPRGRLYLMRAEAEGRVEAGGAFAVHLGRCLGCRACETACPAGVPFGHVLERARDRIPRRPVSRTMQGWLLALLTEPRAARWTYAFARFLRGAGLASWLGPILPGLAGRVLRLLAETRPHLPSLDRGAPVANTSSDPGGDPYCLLTGCVMDGLFRHVHSATRRTLASAGYFEVPAPDQRCCGALHAHAGRMEDARTLARHNILTFEQAPEAWIVSDSAGCGAALRDYPSWLEEDPEWRDRAIAVADRARDVTELLASGQPVRTGSLAGRAAYDAPCHLRHAQGVSEEPLSLLRGVAQLDVEPLPSSERCCGGAGLYNLVEPELAAQILVSKLEEIGRGGYDWVASGNPGCAMYIGAGLRRAGIRTAVVHPVELLDAAWHQPPGD